MKNRDGYEVVVVPIEKVEFQDDGRCLISQGEPGWGTFSLSADELKGFVPQVDDAMVVYTQGFSMIRGVVIDGNVLRYITPKQAKTDHEQMVNNLRLDKLERYIKHGDELKARATTLPKPLRERMERFAAEDGIDFWIESAEYEMYALEGSAALLRKVVELGILTGNSEDYGNESQLHRDAAINWIEDWWGMNSDKHDPPYDYKGQMEIVPDFGDGHSGNTASAAKGLAVLILKGEEV